MSRSALHGSLYSLVHIHGKCLLFPLTWKAHSEPSQSPRICISIECVSKLLSSNGLFWLSGVISQSFLFFPTASRQAKRPTQPPVQWVTLPRCRCTSKGWHYQPLHRILKLLYFLFLDPTVLCSVGHLVSHLAY
jgi:hypothetical protein